MFGLFAELERDLISDRTKVALAAKKAQGVKLGRPKGAGKSKLESHKEQIQELLDGLRLENVLKWQNDVFLNIKKGTLYREMFNNFFIFFLSFSYR